MHSDGTATLINVTATGNRGPDGGGGIIAGGGKLKIGNSIVAGNDSGSFPGNDVDGNFNSLGHNFVGILDNASAGWISSDLTGTVSHPLNPKLGSLANNGGPTATLLPQSGSPVINAGSNSLVPSGITTDQRGLSPHLRRNCGHRRCRSAANVHHWNRLFRCQQEWEQRQRRIRPGGLESLR